MTINANCERDPLTCRCALHAMPAGHQGATEPKPYRYRLKGTDQWVDAIYPSETRMTRRPVGEIPIWLGPLLLLVGAIGGLLWAVIL